MGWSLHLGDDFAHVGADETSRRLRHVAYRVEHGLRRSRILLGVEQPERVLDQGATVVERASPIGGLVAGHAADEIWTVIARHPRGLLFMAWSDLDPPDECVH